jgi:hypothetical protein
VEPEAVLLPEDQLAIIVSDGEDGKGVKATLRCCRAADPTRQSRGLTPWPSAGGFDPSAA